MTRPYSMDLRERMVRAVEARRLATSDRRDVRRQPELRGTMTCPNL